MTGGSLLAALLFQAPPFGWLGSLIVALSVVVALLAYTTGFRWQQHAQPARFGLLSLRLGAIVCLLLTLLHPAWVSERAEEAKPIVAVVLDDSASMSQAIARGGGEATDGSPAETRYSRAIGALREDLMRSLAESHDLRLYDVEARPFEPDDLPAIAAGECSPLTDTLLRVQDDLRDEPLVAIALLSDGAETTERPALGGLEQLRVPVHAVDLVGSSEDGSAGADLAIQAVSTNRRALVGNTVRVLVDVAAEGDPGDTDLPVSILDGGQAVASRVIRWPAGRRVVRAELAFVPQRPGEFMYSVAAGPLPGETDLSNNRQTFPLTVGAKPLTVLYVDGVLRWEGKFIREALAADPDISLISTVRTTRVGADRGSQGVLLAEQLANVDVVILGDVEAAYFSAEEELQALCRWVKESGGGLVLTGGYHSFGPEGFSRSVLRDILPVEFSASVTPQIEQPFNLKLTDAGREHPIFHLTGDRLRDTGFFHKLPPLDGCSRVAGIKPAAEVLAVNPRVGTAEGEPGVPVLVVQQVGAGRTMVFAVDTTWRWRLVVGGFAGDSSFYERFWGQLVRWMASKQDETPPRLFVSTDQSRYKLGETIELNIELRLSDRPDDGADGRDSARGAEPLAWKVAARALDESGKPMNVPLAELGDGKYRGTLAAGRPGGLDLAVSADPARLAGDTELAAESSAQSSVVTVQVDRPDVELLNTRCDRQWLARAAQLSGGRVLPLDEIAAWGRQLPADPVRKAVLRTSGAWGDWLFGGAFLVMICAEWILRRRRQLA
jgi:uncharacterized membrane protein